MALISVSGVGPNTARMILSSLNPAELEQAIASENLNLLKSVKGIGAKTAQRVIVDLKDKIKPTDNPLVISTPAASEVYEEAVAALVMLGFSQPQSQKAVSKAVARDPVDAGRGGDQTGSENALIPTRCPFARKVCGIMYRSIE